MDKFIKPAFNERNVPVAFVCSNQYAPYAGVFLQSMREHASSDHNYDIIVIDMGIYDYNKTLLRRVLDADNFSIRFVAASELIPSDVVENKHQWDHHPNLSVRVLLAHALDGYNRILFTGADMLVRRDIADYMALDLHGHCIGAVFTACNIGRVAINVSEIIHGGLGTRTYMENVLHMQSGEYFNGDAIVYDVNRYCSRFPTDVLVEAMQTPGMGDLDESVLNMLIDGDYEHLPLQWNWDPPLNKRNEAALKVLDEDTKRRYYEAEKDMYLLHFLARPKPWVCPDVPYGDAWWSVARRTPFVGHIIARMLDELQTRREYYKERYGQSVQAWDPMPDVKRDIPSLP